MKIKTMTVWTWGHRPFVMGGDVDYILQTVVPVVRKFTHRGVPLACIEGPTGVFRVAECITGGIVSEGFGSPDAACRAVRKDMAAASKSVIKKQIDDIKQRMNGRSQVMRTTAQFFAAMKA